ncbi:MAG TPA: hypothetical protein VNK04_09385 [Gemmataceae bacterium]|nr:hypothetical protein [Gemmataceae bacterium]
MRRRIWQGRLTAALAAVLVVGCGQSLQPSYRSDPLLVVRKPIEGTPEKAEPARIARAEPVAPEPPPLALASAPVNLRPADKTQLADTPLPSPFSVSASPTARSSDASSAPIHPTVRRRPAPYTHIQ